MESLVYYTGLEWALVSPEVADQGRYLDLGSSSNWGFGVPMGGTPGLPNPQTRPTSAAMTSFAQTIGGSQPATPLDLSEFPSLSSGPQSQNHNSSAQAVWAPQRTTQHTPVQRPQQQSAISQPSSQPLQQQQQPPQPQSQPQQQHDDLFPTSSQFTNGLDDYRFGGQGGVGQLSGSSQPQTGNIDEFPPLGRNGNGEIGQDRRGGLMQNAAFGSHANGNGYGSNLGQPQGLPGRSNLLTAVNEQQDGARSSGLSDRVVSPAGLGSGAISASRSPVDRLRQAQNGFSDLEKNNFMRSFQSNGKSNNSLFANTQSMSQPGSLPPISTKQSSLPEQQRPSQSSQSQQQQQAFSGDLVDSPGPVQTPENVPLSQMSELDRFGLSGLLGMIRHESQDLASLAVGQDLTTLGLDLNQPDNNPLYHTFASPFAETGSRPIEPEFNVPACYTVQNVHPLQSKIPSFSDETLFYIFYTMPRDIIQDIVAGELTNRNWRYHKEQKQWLTKDAQFEPVRVSSTEERGYYIFFDPNTWQRTRRDFLLQYDSLDSRPVGMNLMQGMNT
ncbi:MAG: hypothetical protein M1827_003957 [Pycnora praestabilis]|nr:MAG: hypothetical protein M1827_003957 [Pycnora praestabilis]